MLTSLAAAFAVALTFSAPVPTLADEFPPPVEWSLGVTAIGYQAELDDCHWTRMDFDGVVPIVGAHNYCGGDIILDMTTGQIVHLAGGSVDGTYIVTGDRQVFPGDDAIQATAGLSATVMLQTCYWDVAQGMRLVTLQPVSAQPRDFSRIA